MAAPKLPDDQCLKVLQALHDCGGSQAEAAERLGIKRQTFVSRLNIARGRFPEWSPDAQTAKVPLGDPLPDPDLDIEDVLRHRMNAFQRRHEHHKAARWRRFKVPTTGPYALMLVGDPHLDDDGCNLPLWEKHVELMSTTPNLYAVNIGDTTNNWVGRLARLWANQDASAETARRLVKHYLGERGIPWFLWISGNHDLWDGPVGRDVFERHAPHFVTLADWQAKVTLVSPNGHEMRMWAAHNFKGNSIWNNLHGLERAAQMQDWAHLYVAGHHHDCGYRLGENPHRGFTYNLLRVRGYKFMDEYADHHGFGEYQFGSSAIAVIDPEGDKLNHVTCFMDPAEGVEFLAFKRRKAAA
jgi:hypothetical protein